ncbi:MAG TPA: TetR/AcrR family transcriptional regulator [Luteibacter sp.]|uniref:TetR/AcrR family transcriptional regulator n=1 Tax=Luteibacter sp. TaxID=1886636 RepID=UPI002C0208CB|nr:TetR/AcrR family transcriptional regulator [Luteibacter sp.]HVI55921.1 TetR/AcrR family transcriptional regulator [Luteibacter sp.]
MNTNEAILKAARMQAQSHGYGGLNIRHLAEEVGIKPASIYHHFPGKAELAVAVAKRYWEDAAAELDCMLAAAPDAQSALREYPAVFRRSLENDNRLCLGSFMSAEFDDLPELVRQEMQTFADVNVAWLTQRLVEGNLVKDGEGDARARAIFASIAGAQLMARSRSDIALFDSLIQSYRTAGLLPV